MGTTIRRQPNLTALPKKVTPHYENIINFKGLHITDNPFTAEASSASDLLNVYIDDTNALTVRPRLEKEGITLINTDETLIKAFKSDLGWLVCYKKNNDYKLRFVGSSGDFAEITISENVQLTAPTAYFENGDLLDFQFLGTVIYGSAPPAQEYAQYSSGCGFLFDGGQIKVIRGVHNGGYQCDYLSEIAYAPLTQVGYDFSTDTSAEAQPYNSLTTRYRVSHNKPSNVANVNEQLIGSSGVLHFADGSEAAVEYLDKKDLIGKYIKHQRTLDCTFTKMAVSNNGQYIYGIDAATKMVKYSKNFGETFAFLEVSSKNSDPTNDKIIWTNVYAKRIWTNDDGTTLLVQDDNNIFHIYRNFVELSVTWDMPTVTNNAYDYDNCFVCLSNDGKNFLVDLRNSTLHQTIVLVNDIASSRYLVDTSANSETSEVGVYKCYNNVFCGFYNTKVLDNNIYKDQPIIVIHDIAENKTGTLTCTLSNVKLKLADVFQYDTNKFGFIADSDGEPPNYVTSMHINYIYYWVVEYSSSSSALIITMLLTGAPKRINIYNSGIGAQKLIISTKCLYFDNILYCFSFEGNSLFRTHTFTITNEYQLDNAVQVNSGFPSTTPVDSVYLTTSGCIYFLAGAYSNELYSNNAYDTQWFVENKNRTLDDYNKTQKASLFTFFNNSLCISKDNVIGFSGVDEKGNQRYDYIPEDKIFIVGNTKDYITGFNIVSDDCLVAYSTEHIFLITPIQLTRNDAVIKTYNITECKAEQGNIPFGQTINAPLTSLPIQINKDGVFGLVSLTNVYTADKVASLISEKINDKFLKEDITTALVSKQKNWVVIFIPGDITHVYVYDDRTAEWFYWELPINVKTVYNDDTNLYAVGINGILYKFTPKEKIVPINIDDAVTLYYDDVYVEGADNCFDAYGVQGKNIVWYWTSQTIPLNSVSYAKQLNKTTFIVADSDAADGYAFNYSIKGWRKKRTLVKSSDLDGTVYSIQATTKRTNINRAHFIQLTITNAMLENHQLMLNKTLKTDIDTNDQKVRLIGVSMKYKYLEV